MAGSHPTLRRAARPFTLATAARQRRARGLGADGRDLCGTGRHGPGPRLASLKGSSGFSLSTGDRFGPEGLGPRHGLPESKRGRSAGRRGWAGRAGSGGGGRGPAWDTSDRTRPDPTEPERSQGAVAAPWTPDDLCPALGSGRGLWGGNREPHPGPRRPLRALGPFLPAARAACSEGGSLLRWSGTKAQPRVREIPACAEAGVFFFHLVFSTVSAL